LPERSGAARATPTLPARHPDWPIIPIDFGSGPCGPSSEHERKPPVGLQPLPSKARWVGTEDLFAKAILRRRSIPNLMGQKHAQPVLQPVLGVLPLRVPHLESSVKHALDTARNRPPSAPLPSARVPLNKQGAGALFSYHQ
jgi:hypothetical protein